MGNRPNQNKSREPGPHNVHIIVNRKKYNAPGTI
nr:MAG TPA: hypothetical protein [Bacteriophage sp.]